MTIGHDYFKNYMSIIKKKSRKYSRYHVIKTSKYLLNKY